MRTALIATMVAVALTGCAGNGDEAATDLPPAALEGRSIVRSKGCAACHGADGIGTVGPSFVGLFGSEVAIQGSDVPVVADRDYLIESILEPSAKLREGYNLPMPRTELTDEEIDDVIAYIEALAEDTP